MHAATSSGIERSSREAGEIVPAGYLRVCGAHTSQAFFFTTEAREKLSWSYSRFSPRPRHLYGRMCLPTLAGLPVFPLDWYLNKLILIHICPEDGTAPPFAL